MLFCKHADELLDKTVLESAFEQLDNRNADQSLRTGNVRALFQKKVIILLKCTKCKRVKKIVEVNPD